MYNVTDGYSVIKNVVLVSGAYKDTAQWDYCDVQIKNNEWPNAHIWGNRYNLDLHIHMGKYWSGEPDTYNWYSTLGHESGHYLLGFFDEYLNGNRTKKKSDGSWSYRLQHDNEFPQNYGLMDYQYSSHEMSDIGDYFPRTPLYNDDHVTAQFQIRRERDRHAGYVNSRWTDLSSSYSRGLNCWEYFSSVFQYEIQYEMERNGHTGFSDSFFANLILPPSTSGSYPCSGCAKRPGPATMNRNVLNIIEWTPGAKKRDGSARVSDAMLYVTDSAGYPVPGANVWLASPERRSFQGITDKAGAVRCGSITAGKVLEAYSHGIKAELPVHETKPAYHLTLPLSAASEKRGSAKDNGPGIIVSAAPDDSDPKQMNLRISGDILSSPPDVTVSQSHGYSAAVSMTADGNAHSGTASLEYDSGTLDVTAVSGSGSAQSVSPFEIHSTEFVPASRYSGPEGGLEIRFTSELGSGTFVIVRSTAPSPANGNLTRVGDVWSFGFSSSLGNPGAAALGILLSDGQMDGLDASQLNLYGWNADDRTWEMISGGENDLREFHISLGAMDYANYGLFAPETADMTPPAPITNLQASTGDSRWRVELEWTAPDDNEAVYAYDIRYSTEPITDSNWNDSISAGPTPAPADAGTVQRILLEMPDPGTEYYFAIRASDAAGNQPPMTTLDTPATSQVYADKGDINHDGNTDMKDAVLALQICSGIAEDQGYADADIDGDGKIGMEEAVYALQIAAGLRD